MAVKVNVSDPKFWTGYWRIYGQLTTLKPYQQSVRRCLDLLEIKPEGRYLDLACGMGTTTAALRARATQVVGLDNSESGLALARASLPDTEFVSSDFHALPFFDTDFDGVLMHNGLYLARDPGQVLTEIGRVLRPNGRLVMSNPKPDANPLAIVKKQLASVWKETDYLKRYQVVTEFFRVMGIFLQFKPYVEALVGEYGDQSHKWDRVEWERVILLANKKGARLRVFPIAEDGYAGQNSVFVLGKE